MTTVEKIHSNVLGELYNALVADGYTVRLDSTFGESFVEVGVSTMLDPDLAHVAPCVAGWLATCERLGWTADHDKRIDIDISRRHGMLIELRCRVTREQ